MSTTPPVPSPSTPVRIAARDDWQPGTLTLSLLDRELAATVVDQGRVPAWSADPPGIVSLAPAADGLSTQVTFGQGTGEATVHVELTDADGTVVDIPDTVFDVTAGEPVSGVVTFTPAPVAPASPPPPTTPGVPTGGTGGTTTTPPAPTPTGGTSNVAMDPANGKPLYTYSGAAAIDPSAWPVASDVTGANGETLYTFSSDTAGSAPTGTSSDWTPYDGTPQPAAPAGGGTGGGGGTSITTDLDPAGFTTTVVADPTRWP